MNGKSHSRAEILLIKAAEDEGVLRLPGLASSIAGFHAQQAVEKMLKALLSAHSVEFERTHDLKRLAQALKAVGEALPAMPLPLSDLTGFAVVYRYDLAFSVVLPEIEDLLETIRILREHIVARIAALSAAG